MKHLKDKWLLLDTNVIIEMSLHPNDPFWVDFENQLNELNCKPVIVNEILFELTRSMNSEYEEKRILEFIENSNIERIPEKPKELWVKATKIGQIYALNKLNHISQTDCLLAAYLENYSPNLNLATFNNKDFPLKLFNREVLLNFEIQDEIKVMGIYSFSKNNFKNQLSNFKKSRAGLNN